MLEQVVLHCTRHRNDMGTAAHVLVRGGGVCCAHRDGGCVPVPRQAGVLRAAHQMAVDDVSPPLSDQAAQGEMRGQVKQAGHAQVLAGDALRLADVALYLAKEQGRNQVVSKRQDGQASRP